MGLMDKARQTAEQARAGMLGERPPEPAETADPGAIVPPPPSSRMTGAVSAFLEKINPGLLADLIIHATAAQEKTNQALKDKGSSYRISEMYLTASIPPQVGFYIARIGDAGSEAPALPALPAPASATPKKAGPVTKAGPKKAGSARKAEAPPPAGP